MNDPYAGMSAEEQAVMAAMMSIVPIILLIGLVVWIFSIFVQWKILSKAGYSGALSLLNLIPILGQLIMAIVWIWFAFADWPVLKRARGEPVV